MFFCISNNRKIIWILQLWIYFKHDRVNFKVITLLYKKFPNTEFFWSVFIPNTGKYTREKLCIWILFTQCTGTQLLFSLSGDLYSFSVWNMILIDSMSDVTLNSSLRKLYCRILFTLSTKKEVNCWALGNFSKGFMICVFIPRYVLERICLLLMFAAFGWIIYVIWQTIVEAFWCLLVIIANNFSAYFLQVRIFSLLACWCSHLWNKLHVNFLVCCQSKGT